MRAKTHASGRPSNKAIAVANNEVINDSRSASEAGPLVTEAKTPDQATRFSSPTKGNDRNRRASDAPTNTNFGVSVPTRRSLAIMGAGTRMTSIFANPAPITKSQ